MDKFGIFNLLNSFFSFYEKNKKDNNDTPKPNFTENANEKKFATQSESKTPPRATPLQNTMLSTMYSHDAFIRRVKEKNKK